jgi:hypothetical protein
LNVDLQIQDAAPGPKRHHLLIAGTGRAGTSFLVRFLTELGLDTHISRYGEKAWDDAAEAGLEDVPVVSRVDDLPYAFKTPWAYQCIEQMLADPAIAFDAVIIPIRDLVEAAASRSIVQLQAIHRQAPWMARMDTTWDNWGLTAGGTVYSLDSVDQSRLLAVGFHRLVNRLVQSEVPLIFVAFPRLVEDTDYLIDRLSPIIPGSISLDDARQAHRRVADTALVRVGRELRGNDGWQALPTSATSPMPTLRELDNIALRREIVALRDEARRLRYRLAVSEAERAALARSQLVRRVARRLRRVLFAILPRSAEAREGLKRRAV